MKLLVTGLDIKDFPLLVEKARILEKTKKEFDGQMKQQQ